MRGGHAKINEINEREGAPVYWCICGSIMRKVTYGWFTKQKTPSEKYCSWGFFRIFVDRLSVESNHSLKGLRKSWTFERLSRRGFQKSMFMFSLASTAELNTRQNSSQPRYGKNLTVLQPPFRLKYLLEKETHNKKMKKTLGKSSTRSF